MNSGLFRLFFRGIVPACASLGVMGCLHHGLNTPETSISFPSEMRLVPSRNQPATLGSLDQNASRDFEQPLMRVSFSYDFAMDTVEVTRDLYAELMAISPAKISHGGNCGQCPIAQVTYFDAVLFCNARSRKAGLDTVYSYSGVLQDSSHRVYALSGLITHFDRPGYRLPTEAEWQFAAQGEDKGAYVWGSQSRGDTPSQFAWYSRNAHDSSHPVGELQANTFGLYDMAGNVMEWVEDWKGQFLDTALLDYAGPRHPNNLSERIVKGGAFSYGLDAMRISARSTSYGVLASTSGRDIGFRCAIGSIPKPNFTQSGGIALTMPNVELAIAQWPIKYSDFSLSDTLAARPGKLAFVNVGGNRRVLNFIDFSKQPLTVHEFFDMEEIHYPTISPDGKWVTWCNALEGMDMPARGYIRALDWPMQPATRLPFASVYMPRWNIDPESKDTLLVFSSSAITNTSDKWKSGKTWKVGMKGGSPSGPPELISDGSFHDGLSSDARYLITGFQNIIVKDLVTQEQKILFTAPENGKSLGDTSQVCNVSMGPSFSTSGQSLFLDFGYSEKSALVGRPYGLHEILFRANAQGKVIGFFPAPKTHAAWADAEWSNHPDYAISGLEARSGDRNTLTLVHLARGETSNLITGLNLADPALWINTQKPLIPSDILDSMGRYNEPERDIYQAEYAAKMQVFWLNRKNLEIAAIGSSHVKCGIAAQDFSNPTVNLGWSAGDIKGASVLTHRYLLPLAPKLKVLIVEILPGWLGYGAGEVSWDPIMSKTKGYAYDSTHSFWNKGIPKEMESLQKEIRNTTWESFDSLGSAYYPDGSWEANPADDFHGSTGWNTQSTRFLANLKIIQELIGVCDSSRVQIILVHFPLSPHYRNTQAYSEYGPDNDIGPQVIGEVRALCGSYSYCNFYDAHLDGNHDYAENEAFNSGHLATSGARKLTSRLDSLIRRLPLRSTP